MCLCMRRPAGVPDQAGLRVILNYWPSSMSVTIGVHVLQLNYSYSAGDCIDLNGAPYGALFKLMQSPAPTKSGSDGCAQVTLQLPCSGKSEPGEPSHHYYRWSVRTAAFPCNSCHPVHVPFPVLCAGCQPRISSSSYTQVVQKAIQGIPPSTKSPCALCVLTLPFLDR